MRTAQAIINPNHGDEIHPVQQFEPFEPGAGIAPAETRPAETQEPSPLLQQTAPTDAMQALRNRSESIAQTGNERFAYDAYRRFIMMFSDVAFGLSKLVMNVYRDWLGESATRALRVLVQVDLAGEPTKFGLEEAQLLPVLEALRGEAGLRIEGLMLLPPYFEEAEQARRSAETPSTAGTEPVLSSAMTGTESSNASSCWQPASTCSASTSRTDRENVIAR